MKKRSVKAFDISLFETKEEVVAEIKRLETIKRKKGKKLAKAEDACTCAVVVGLATVFLSFLVMVGSAFPLVGYTKELNSTADQIEDMEEFKAIQLEDINSLTEKLNNGTISKKEFDSEYQKLNTNEYIRNVASSICENTTIEKFDAAQKSQQIGKNIMNTAGCLMVLSGVASFGHLTYFDSKQDRYKNFSQKTNKNLQQLYSKKADLEYKEIKEKEEI